MYIDREAMKKQIVFKYEREKSESDAKWIDERRITEQKLVRLNSKNVINWNLDRNAKKIFIFLKMAAKLRN